MVCTQINMDGRGQMKEGLWLRLTVFHDKLSTFSHTVPLFIAFLFHKEGKGKVGEILLYIQVITALRLKGKVENWELLTSCTTFILYRAVTVSILTVLN